MAGLLEMYGGLPPMTPEEAAMAAPAAPRGLLSSMADTYKSRGLLGFVPPELRGVPAAAHWMMQNVVPGSSDVSSLMDYSRDTVSAGRDAMAGNWSGAGSNAISALTNVLAAAPLVPALGALKDVRPAKENLRTVLDSNFLGGRLVGNRTVPIDTLVGGATASDRAVGRIKELADQISGPAGYIERLIVDKGGNVIEGAHRLEALKSLGVKRVPVTMVEDTLANVDLEKMRGAIRAAGSLPSDHVNQIMRHVGEMVADAGSPAAALKQYELPRGFEKYFQAALEAMR